MKTIRDPEVLKRGRITFELAATAEALMRQNLRRRYPEASEEELREHFIAWLQKRGEPFLAGLGRPASPEEIERLFGPIPEKPIPPPARKPGDLD